MIVYAIVGVILANLAILILSGVKSAQEEKIIQGHYDNDIAIAKLANGRRILYVDEKIYKGLKNGLELKNQNSKAIKKYKKEIKRVMI